MKKIAPSLEQGNLQHSVASAAIPGSLVQIQLVRQRGGETAPSFLQRFLFQREREKKNERIYLVFLSILYWVALISEEVIRTKTVAIALSRIIVVVGTIMKELFLHIVSNIRFRDNN